MLTIKQGIKISAIIDKLELKITDPKAPQEQVGADLMIQIIAKAHKAEQEIYNLVAEIKGCTVSEAEKIDLIEFVKDLTNTPGVMDFLHSAVK